MKNAIIIFILISFSLYANGSRKRKKIRANKGYPVVSSEVLSPAYFSFKELKEAAEKGSFHINYLLAKAYLTGNYKNETISKDTEEAIKIMTNIVEKNVITSISKRSKFEKEGYKRIAGMLGKLLLKKEEPYYNLEKGIKLLEKSIDLGDSKNRSFLAHTYVDAYGEKKIDKVIELLDTAISYPDEKEAFFLYGKLLLLGEYIPQDLERARGFLKKVYASQDSGVFSEKVMGKVMYYLGVFELLGLGEESKNEKRAVELLKSSGKIYNGEALFLLSWMYRNGFAVEQDFFEANNYFNTAVVVLESSQESLEKQMRKIKTVEEMPVIERILNSQKKESDLMFTILINEKKELVNMKTLKKEVDSGNLSAVLSLAKAFLLGRQVLLDVHKSTQLYSQVIEEAKKKISQPSYKILYREASYRLGVLYLTGDGIEQNIKLGERFLQTALYLGKADSVAYLMEHYKNLKDMVAIYKIIKKLEKTAQNSLKDRFILAKIYLNGKFIPANFVKARGLLEQIISDKEKLPLSKKYKTITHYYLSVFELLGLGAESKNEERALELLNYSLATRYPQALLISSWMHYHGVGVKQDRVKSEMLFNQIKKTYKVKAYKDEVEGVQSPKDLSVIKRLILPVSVSCKSNFHQ